MEDIAKKEKKLALHEAGHLVMNILVRKLNLKSNIKRDFSTPTAIMINGKTGGGEVTSIGFPIDCWGKINDGGNIENKIFRSSFYPKHPKFALGNALILIGGHTIEACFNRKERLDYNSFGKEIGESNDKEKFDKIIGFLIKPSEKKSEGRFDKEKYEEARERKVDILRKYIVNLKKKEKGICNAVKKLKKAILNKKEKENGEKKIEGFEFLKLLHEVEQELENVSIDDIMKNGNFF